MLKTIAISAVVSAIVSWAVIWVESRYNEHMNRTFHSPLCEEHGGYLFSDLAGNGRCISQEVMLSKPRE